ncbi:MAG: Gfo/Idh/MocA family oxidoreductase [Peptostreptococcaceae bacterium]|jgi:thiazolinyl imide reductase|nr:Gfo/Idh/MocA family oxidoreductase [Peptostreptococcaceae bacterium]
MKKYNVIVCGTTFGQFYIEAIKTSNNLNLVGILAGGSERSIKCAQFNNVPLFKNIDELPDDVDIACVVIRSGAIGGIGTDLAIKLMNKKIHVIQEQPMHPKDLQNCYKASMKNKVNYVVGNLYPNMMEIKKFIECAKFLNENDKLLYARASFAPQVSYPAMKMLLEAMPSIRNINLENVSKSKEAPFDLFTGYIGDIPTTVEYQNYINPSDPDNHMHLLHSITFVYESGRLVLSDTFGPTIWHPKMHVENSLYDRANLKDKYPKHLKDNTVNFLDLFEEKTYENVITNEWPKAIYKDLMSLVSLIEKKTNYMKLSQKELLCSTNWSNLTKHFGFANLVDKGQVQNIKLEYLKDVLQNII